MVAQPWPTVVVGGKEYWEVDIKGRIAKESDPDAGVLFLIGTPNGGVANVGPLVKGDPGVHAEIDTTVVNTVLEWDDSTPDSMSWTVLVPPTDDTPGVYQLNATQRKGPPGDDGNTILDPGDFGSPLAGQILVVNDAEDAFEARNQKVATRHVPATLNNVPSGNANYTLGVVSVAAKTFDWRPMVFAHTIITGYGGSDVAVNLRARLNGESGGNIVAECRGLAGAKDRLTIVSAIPAGSGDSFDKVAAGSPATIHLRTERASGSDTYTTASGDTFFEVWAMPI